MEAVMKEVVEKLETLVEENKLLWAENMKFSLELSKLKKQQNNTIEKKEDAQKLENTVDTKGKDKNLDESIDIQDSWEKDGIEVTEKPAVQKTKKNTTKK